MSGLLLRLDPAEFLRVHPSHAVNIRVVRELRPLVHGEYAITLAEQAVAPYSLQQPRRAER